VSYFLLSYQGSQSPRAGIVVGEEAFDAAELTGNVNYSTALGVLSDWQAADHAFSAAVDRISAGSIRAGAIKLSDLSILAPVLYPGNIYCAGANYKDHVAEMARAMKQPVGPTVKELGGLPWHFVKTSRSVVGPNRQVKLPSYSKAIDWEIELAVIIGKSGKDVAVEHALDYVAGYTIANDLSARDVIGREHTPATSPFYYDWISMKCFDGACPMGPWLTPASQIPNPQNLALKLWISGQLMQDSHTSQMIFDVAEQVAMLSSRITLFPGDVILTGTPAGVGMPRGVFLKPGDVVKLWIERIGEMSHSVL
jgi:2-keto-4-pentenoate hydratase/2-oxohepta-3-ene-1,7-dioic acid hydratase in catechol pathway